MFVAGAAALVALGDVVTKHFSAGLGSELVRSDPLRIIQAMITGMGFLRAGTIPRHSTTRQVEGLTIAASLMFASAVGVCVSLSQLVLAVGRDCQGEVTLIVGGLPGRSALWFRPCPLQQPESLWRCRS